MSQSRFDDVVLVTGFPSFVARRMCDELLRDERTHVVALAHQKFAAEAEAYVARLDAGVRDRVTLVEGDAASIDFGLSGNEYGALARQVRRMHHMAKVSYQGASPELAHAVNVGATREALLFAEQCRRLSSFVHHSTVFVAGDRTGTVFEHELRKGQGFRTEVERSRAIAEKMVQGAMSRLPISVVRPALTIGDSLTGEFDRLDGPYLPMLLIVASPRDFTLPLLGRATHPLCLVPIDFVVRAADVMGRDPRAVGKTFHLCDPMPLSAARTFELVSRASHGAGAANATSFAKTLLQAPGLERFVKSPRTFLERMLTPVQFDTTNADAILSETSVRCPPFESYVDKVVLAILERLRDRPTLAGQAGHQEGELDDPLE